MRQELKEKEEWLIAFLRQYPLIPARMKERGLWSMESLNGEDTFEFHNRYGKGAHLSIRKRIIVQIDFIREHQKNLINSSLSSDLDAATRGPWARKEMWDHTASTMASLFLLNRFKLADRVYRYMEDLCKKT